VSFKIAVAGKGGTGKTTLACLILGSLLRRGKTPVLAVDADPNSCLAEYLGLEPAQTLGEIQAKLLATKSEMPAGVAKAQIVEYEAHSAVREGAGYDLVTMGRTEGPGCYCYVNSLLRGFMAEIEKNYAAVVVDNEAGLEHLSRRTSRDVDVLAVVADESRASRKAGERIGRLVDELEIGAAKRSIILNRMTGDACGPSPVTGLDLAGCVPADPNLAALEEKGESLLNLPAGSPASKAVDEILEKFID
jgi:CO dehydrogenase maturation factor